MAVFKLKSKASYESGGLEVRAKISIVVRWRDSLERRRLAAELSTYTTPRELMELEALMERYDDGETAEMRSILAAQAGGQAARAAPGPVRLSGHAAETATNGSFPGTRRDRSERAVAARVGQRGGEVDHAVAVLRVVELGGEHAERGAVGVEEAAAGVAGDARRHGGDVVEQAARVVAEAGARS